MTINHDDDLQPTDGFRWYQLNPATDPGLTWAPASFEPCNGHGGAGGDPLVKRGQISPLGIPWHYIKSSYDQVFDATMTMHCGLIMVNAMVGKREKKWLNSPLQYLFCDPLH